jgi:hypothetical protein
VLDRTEASYRDIALSVATETAALVHTFLAEHRSAARSTGTVLKAMRSLHQTGELDARFTDYETRLRAGVIVDPSFPADLHALEVIAALPVSTPRRSSAAREVTARESSARESTSVKHQG